MAKKNCGTEEDLNTIMLAKDMTPEQLRQLADKKEKEAMKEKNK